MFGGGRQTRIGIREQLRSLEAPFDVLEFSPARRPIQTDKCPAALMRSPGTEDAGHKSAGEVRHHGPARHARAARALSSDRIYRAGQSRSLSPHEHTCIEPLSSIQTINGPFPITWPILCIIFTIFASVGIALLVTWPSAPMIVT
jgi:hypothetical protein